MKKIQKLFLFLLIKLKTRSSFPFKQEDLARHVAGNRKDLKKINTWIDQNAFDNSYFSYGVPEYIRPLLDKEINTEPTYTDLIAYYSTKLPSGIKYLELGVSVGKNFFQLMNRFENAEMAGFDIENINPVLEKQLEFTQKESWKLSVSSLRKQEAYLNRYRYNTNEVIYLAGDIYDESCWAKLKGRKFNIIFSDALHEPEALLFEYRMMMKYDLLDDTFMIFWDDLNRGLERSFLKILGQIRKDHKSGEKTGYLVKINGWLGQHEKKHDVGLITNITF